jgi:Leucine-rich repeat (LRR) protein
VSTSSAALREQIAKAKAARKGDTVPKVAKTPEKSSNALREQIAKAKAAARQAHTAKQFGDGTPPREVPAVTENDFGIEPDPEEISQFDFGLDDDPFNQRSKGSKSLLRKRVDAARVDGRLNVAAMGLTEIPDEVLQMYKYDPNDSSVAWGEVVDLTSIIAADNELANVPDGLFPDVDFETMGDTDDEGPQFGGVQSLDLHGNNLCDLPLGLRHLSQLSKLNLVSVIELYISMLFTHIALSRGTNYQWKRLTLSVRSPRCVNSSLPRIPFKVTSLQAWGR